MMTPTSPQELLQLLDEQKVNYQLFHHLPLYSVEDALRERGGLGGSYVKNLYLKDRQGRMALVICLNHRDVNLQRLRRGIGYTRLSFASADQLMNDLGVHPGSISPFALINAQPDMLRFFADKTLQKDELTNLHPLTNEMTVQLPLKAWVGLCERWGFKVEWLNFDLLPEEGQ